MNAIDERLLKLKVEIEKNSPDGHTTSRVMGAIQNLNFGGLSTVELYLYEISLNSDDRNLFVSLGGGNPNPQIELTGAELYRLQEASFKLEFIRQRDLEDVEIAGRVVPAFDYGMLELFGRDWENQLAKPRGSQSVSVGKSDTGEIKQVPNKNGKIINRKVRDVVYKQVGAPVLSLKPIEMGKHPEEDGTLIHQPTPEGLGCGYMLKEIYWALATKSVKDSASGGDMTGGGNHRKVFIVGIVPHEKSRLCGEIGCIQTQQDGLVSLGDYNKLLADTILFCHEENDSSLLTECLEVNPLIAYYMERYGMCRADARKVAINVMAGVSKDRLTKNGMAPKIYMGKVPDDLYQDAAAQAGRSHRYLEAEINQVIRGLLGRKKLNSAESLAGVEDDIEDWWDEINPETGLTYYDMAVDKLHARWKNQARSTIREMGVAKFNNATGELVSLDRKNFGKCGRSKDAKRRTFDKSTTVNGARCRTLTTAFLHVEVTCDVEPPCASEFGFKFNGESWVISEEMNWIRFFQIGLVAGLDWAAVAAEECLSDDPFKMSRGVDEMSSELNKLVDKLSDVDADLDKLLDSPQWEDVHRLVNRLMLNCSNMSSTEMFKSGNGWLTFRDHLSPESVLIEVRHIDVDELKRLQNARERIMACGKELNERNILDSLRHPGKWVRKSGGKIGSAVSVERLAEIKAMIAAA